MFVLIRTMYGIRTPYGSSTLYEMSRAREPGVGGRGRGRHRNEPFEPIWGGKHRVGFVTSGGYGHTVSKSLAMAYVDTGSSAVGTELDVHIVGDKRRCTVIATSPFDPSGKRMRA